MKNGEDNLALQYTNDYLKSENDLYYLAIGRMLKSTLFSEAEDAKESKKSSSASKKTEDPRKGADKLNCLRDKPYYSICRLFRLQYYMEMANGKGTEIHKHYINILRVLAPFLEEDNLSSIPYLDVLDEELPAKLAFMGFAKEAIFFQKMLTPTRSKQGSSSANPLFREEPYERLAFFHILAGEWAEADLIYQYILRESKLLNKKPSALNKTYLRLGMIAYLRGEYDRSLDSYLGIDFKDWPKSITHPILNEPLTVMSAKDLIAISVWKSRGGPAAVRALNEIQLPSLLTEEDLWPKLRMAQVMVQDNPEVASKLADEIIYMAQGQGWKRIEYAATVVQGYLQILTKNYRRSTIEFTKSRSILAGEDQEFASDWMRYTGTLFAHQASGKKAPLEFFINESLRLYKSQPIREDILTVRNYKPVGFTQEEFLDLSLGFLKDKGDAQTAFELLHSYSLNQDFFSEFKELGLGEIPFVSRQFSHYLGFHTPRDAKYIDSSYSQAREEEAIYLKESNPAWKPKNFTSTKYPFLAVFPLGKTTYLFAFDPKAPKTSQWQMDKLEYSTWESNDFKNALYNLVLNFKEPESLQVYLNKPGLSAYDHLRNQLPNTLVSLFGFFQAQVEPVTRTEWTPVAWDCEGNQDLVGGIQWSDRHSFEGTKIFKSLDRIYLWNFPYVKNKGASLSEYQWACDSQKDAPRISLQRISRRLDYRTVPKSMVVSERILEKGLFEARPPELMDFSRFWLEQGVTEIYFTKKSSPSADAFMPLFSKIQSSGDRIQHDLQSQVGDKGIFITKDLR